MVAWLSYPTSLSRSRACGFPTLGSAPTEVELLKACLGARRITLPSGGTAGSMRIRRVRRRGARPTLCCFATRIGTSPGRRAATSAQGSRTRADSIRYPPSASTSGWLWRRPRSATRRFSSWTSSFGFGMSDPGGTKGRRGYSRGTLLEECVPRSDETPRAKRQIRNGARHGACSGALRTANEGG